ncbi:MAG: hypothetical protein D6731_00670 [Planctomycetota bacterium]|nr:MAG: hypothetical protein D6731_00670 [Planctomycetota bacterium]
MKAAALAISVLLVGCCAGPRAYVQDWDERLAVEGRARFALICPLLDERGAWAYAEPVDWAQALRDAYRPGTARAAGRDAVRPLAEAPGLLGRAARAARAALVELGYRPARPGEARGEDAFVCAVALTTDDAGNLLRVAVHLGADADRGFAPHRVSLAAEWPVDKDPCAVAVEEVVSALVSALPPREEGP